MATEITADDKKSTKEAKKKVAQAQQQFKEEKAAVETKYTQKVDTLNEQLVQKDEIIQELSKQTQVSQTKANEKSTECEQLKEQHEKMAKDCEEKEKAVVQMQGLFEQKAEQDIMKHLELQ